jgi:hypothetical protein
MASLMPRILVRTSAPIFNGLRRHVLKAEGVIEEPYAAYCRIIGEVIQRGFHCEIEDVFKYSVRVNSMHKP